MIIYMAGNFPLMNNIDEERDMKNLVFHLRRDYNRLLSFYYPNGAKNVLGIRKEVDDRLMENFAEDIRIITAFVDALYKEYGRKVAVGGVKVCPKCGNNLHFSQRDNGHVWGKCETKDCLEWGM